MNKSEHWIKVKKLLLFFSLSVVECLFFLKTGNFGSLFLLIDYSIILFFVFFCLYKVTPSRNLRNI